jgi:putative ABC transport system permease protein
VRHSPALGIMFLLASTASAAAAVGPAFYSAAQRAIATSAFTNAAPSNTDLEVIRQGPVVGAVRTFTSSVEDVMDATVGPTQVTAIFQPPVGSVIAASYPLNPAVDMPIGWQDGFCSHLTMLAGRCAEAPGQVVVSPSLDRFTHWRVGQRVKDPGFGMLQVSGVYAIPDLSLPYWAAEATTYFPTEDPASLSGRGSTTPYDVIFTPEATIDAAAPGTAGTLFLDQFVRPGGLTPGEVSDLTTAAAAVSDDFGLAQAGDIVITNIAGTVALVRSSWSALAVAVVVVTAELLLFLWLLLFLVVAGYVENLGQEIALAKLRGFGRLRVFAFGNGEPLLVLAVAFPVGALAGWAATGLLAGAALPPGTIVSLPGLSWFAASLAIAGGAGAAVLASWRALRREVVDSWRDAGGRRRQRGWALDVGVLVAAVAGIVELRLGGAHGSATSSIVGLLVPALCAIAVAVAGSRLVPLAARGLYGRTRHAGGLAAFLAVRYLARRRRAAELTMCLCASFALVTFGVASFVVAQHNRSQAAALGVGADTVLTVLAPTGRDLGALVDKADRTGREAAAVEVFSEGGPPLLAVQPARFGKVADWPPGVSPATVDHLMASIQPPAPAPVTLGNGLLRARLAVTALRPSGVVLDADVVVPGAGVESVPLATLTGTGTETTAPVQVNGCPCVLRDLSVSDARGSPGSGAVEVLDLQENSGGPWAPVPGALDRIGGWAAAAQGPEPERATDRGGHLRWWFTLTAGGESTVDVVDTPVPLPAVTTPSVGPPAGPFTVAGLDGAPLAVTAVGRVAAVPGAPTNGVIVDLTYAELGSVSQNGGVVQQVWVAAGDAAAVTGRLKAEGVALIASETASGRASTLDESGPGLGSALYLADAVAAGLLAALVVVEMLASNATRRRLELAALAVAGAPFTALRRSVALEQATEVFAGLVLGLLAGLVGVALGLRAVPEFVEVPSGVPLAFGPPVALLLAVLGGALVAAALVVWLSGAALVRSIDLARQLREAMP